MWLIFACTVPFLWGATNVIDSALRKHYIKDDLSLTWIINLARLPVAVLFIVFSEKNFAFSNYHLIMIVAGSLWAISTYWYLKALSFEEASRVSLLLQILPVSTLILSYFIINERLTFIEGSAFALILLGGILAATKKMQNKWRCSPALPLIIISCILWSLSDILYKKYEPNFPDFINAFGWLLFGSSIPFLFFLFSKKSMQTISDFCKNMPSSGWILVIAEKIAEISGSLIFARALTLGPASLTSVIVGIQPLFVIILGIIFSAFSSNFTNELLTPRVLILKGVSLLLIINGLMLIV